jgi:phosphoserine phosphatase
MDKRQLFISDVCDTLYFSNTTFDFLHFFAQKEKKGQFWLNLISSKKSPINWLAYLFTKFFKNDYYRIWAIKLLKNTPKETIDNYAKEFVRLYLNDKKIIPCFELIEKAQENGAEVILASSSLTPIIAIIAAQFDCKYYGSNLLFDKNGHCLGKLEREITGKKISFFKNLNREIYNEIIVMTDNFSDYSLAEWADKKIIVVYNDVNKAFWQKLNPTFISINKIQ